MTSQRHDKKKNILKRIDAFITPRVSRTHIKNIFILSLISICASCGNTRVDYPDCIKPTELRSIYHGDFVFHEPISPWSGFKTKLNSKWTDARICIEAEFSENVDCHADSFKKRYNITSLPGKTNLKFDGFVRVTEPWGIPRFFTRKISVFYRGKLDNDYFWLSAVQLEALNRKINSGSYNSVLILNISALEYFESDSKLKTRSRSRIWPCDPKVISQRESE